MRPTPLTLLSLLPLFPLLGCAAHSSPATGSIAPSDSVSVGYGRVARAKNTTAISGLDTDELSSAPVGRVEELLRGRMAGVEVYRNQTGDYSIRIRGATSLSPYGNTEPLIVIDGSPAQSFGNVLNGLSPHDIERIEVLKDAGAAAIYGSRGANGVILITSRRSHTADSAKP